jgi:hypothetical protein
MRIELVYAPGCNTHRKALDLLETVIAEERLPIAIEQVEDGQSKTPVIRISGFELGEPTATFEGDPCFLSSTSTPAGAKFHEHLRRYINQKWNELTIPA